MRPLELGNEISASGPGRSIGDLRAYAVVARLAVAEVRAEAALIVEVLEAGDKTRLRRYTVDKRGIAAGKVVAVAALFSKERG